MGLSLSQIKMRSFKVMRAVMRGVRRCSNHIPSDSLQCMRSFRHLIDEWNLLLLAALGAVGALILLLPWDLVGLDSRLYYSGAEALQILGSLSFEQRNMYKTFELLDFIFIALYTTLFVRNLSHVYGFKPSLFGLIPGFLDCIENFGVIYWLYRPGFQPYLQVLGVITFLKWALGVGVVLATAKSKIKINPCIKLRNGK